MGEPIIYDHEGREAASAVRAVPQFEKDPAKYLLKIERR